MVLNLRTPRLLECKHKRPTRILDSIRGLLHHHSSQAAVGLVMDRDLALPVLDLRKGLHLPVLTDPLRVASN